MISHIEKTYFNSLLNRGGYVLDFSTEEFDNFTSHSVGTSLCSTYGLPKGKSLREFMNEGDNDKIVKLLDDFLEYYAMKYLSGMDSGEKTSREARYKVLYNKCKEIIEREKQSLNEFLKESEYLKEKFSSDYMSNQIDLAIEACSKNPTEAIGKSKELIESCCITIIEGSGKAVDRPVDMGRLIRQAFSLLKIPNEKLIMDPEEGKIVRRIIGSLNGLNGGIVELRNYYGSGHGRSVKFKGLTKRHAELSVGSSITLVRYLWDTFLLMKEKG